MKILPKAFRPILLVITGIALAFISAALSFTASALQGATPTPIPATLVVKPTPTLISEVGSSDGILLLAAVIVFIIILPILWNRRTWMRA